MVETTVEAALAAVEQEWRRLKVEAAGLPVVDIAITSRLGVLANASAALVIIKGWLEDV